MLMCRDVKLSKGFHSSDHSRVEIIDAETREIVADNVKVEYAELIIKAVNEYED